MPFDNRKLFTTSALALSCALAAPAAARTAGPDDPATTAPVEGQERLVASKAAQKADGKLRPFAGDLLPNRGRIRSFAGEVMGTRGRIRSFSDDGGSPMGETQAAADRINAFRGRIRSFSYEVSPQTVAASQTDSAAFWGTLAPRAGTLSASRGRIRSFNDDFELMADGIRAFRGRIRSFSGDLLGHDAAPAEYAALNGQFRALVDQTKATWGAAILQQTGRSFEDAFANRMLVKWDIDLKDARSLNGLDEVDTELFLLDWHDNLMLYSGQDQVDHWMKPINWSPTLTQSMGSGYDAKIGILDFALTGEERQNVLTSSGLSGATDNHGSAVASLITAKHDGRGVMGIAPTVRVLSYNPFDATNTAGWTDVAKGVRFLMGNGASIINMSLGVPGSTLHSGWNDVFNDPWMSSEAKKRVFVVAAGNEGVTQTGNVQWNHLTNPHMIVVGSVDPNGTISEFSNRPGEACLVTLLLCTSSANKLKERFIVAPGEFLLVSDGEGGVSRMSGTSFAAPLVSGTIALVHDRWPWLSDNPVDTVDIILNSTRDLGAKGTDAVYGRGMLDVQKALSPTNFFALKWKRAGADGKLKDTTASSVLETSQSTIATWEATKTYFTVYESTGNQKDSYRDFSIPMSSKLLGQTVGNTGEQFNAYLQGRFWSWFNANQDCDDDCGDDDDDGDDFATRRFGSPVASIAGLNATAIATPREYRPGLRQSSMPHDTGLALRSADRRFGLRFGSGEGASLSGQRGFALRSDYDVTTGGANPFLGLASGAGYAAVDMKIGDRVTVSTGVSRQDAVMDLDRMSSRERQILGGVDPYRATANTMTVAYRASGRLTTSVGYTMLNEDTGLLGVRSLDPNDLTSGSTTDAATFGADYAAANGLSVALTGTVGRTRAGDTASQGITVAGGGLVSSSWQVAVAKTGLFDGNDRVRLTLAQPLHVERGRIGITGIEVVDRMTGELGDVTQIVDLDRSQRRFVAEALYGRAFAGGMAQVNLFGRADLGADERTQAALTLGGSFRLGF